MENANSREKAAMAQADKDLVPVQGATILVIGLFVATFVGLALNEDSKERDFRSEIWKQLVINLTRKP